MSVFRLTDRMTSPYKTGARMTELAQLQSNGYSVAFTSKYTLDNGAPILVKVDSFFGSISLDIKVYFTDGANESRNIGISIPAESWEGRILFIDLTDVTPTGTAKEITNIVVGNSNGDSPGTKGDKASIWSVEGNMSKLMSSISEQVEEVMVVLRNDVVAQRYLSTASGYGLDLHGASVGVLRKGLSDDEYRGEIRTAMVFGPATRGFIAEALSKFAGLSSTPTFLEWWSSGWIINVSQLFDDHQSECILGAMAGIGEFMSEVTVSRLDSNRTIDEIQTFLESIIPVSTYCRVCMKFMHGTGTSMYDSFGELSEADYTNPSLTFIIYTYEQVEAGDSLLFAFDDQNWSEWTMNDFYGFTFEQEEEGEGFSFPFGFGDEEDWSG